MVAEVIVGLSSLKAAFDIAKGLKDIDNATNRNAAVIELQEKILGAQQTQATLIERIGDLEKEVARLETWNTEKQRYQLTEIGDGNFAYALKESMSSGEPPHYICTACYDNSKKAILHHFETGSGMHVVTCPKCSVKMPIDRDYNPPSYLQSAEDKTRANLEKCPVCQTGRLRVMAVNPHPTHGVLGVQEKDLACDRCEHVESRWHDPKKTR